MTRLDTAVQFMPIRPSTYWYIVRVWTSWPALRRKPAARARSVQPWRYLPAYHPGPRIHRWHYRRFGPVARNRTRREDRAERHGVSTKLSKIVEGRALQKPALPIAALYPQVRRLSKELVEKTPIYGTVFNVVRASRHCSNRARKQGRFLDWRTAMNIYFAVFALLASCLACLAQQYMLSTVAGGAPPPTQIEPLAASIGSGEIVTDSAGSVYFQSSHCVLKLIATASSPASPGTAERDTQEMADPPPTHA